MQQIKNIISSSELLSNIKKIDSKVFAMIKPFLAGMGDTDKDNFMYLLMANGISGHIEGGLVNFINKCFSEKEETKSKKTEQLFVTRKFDNVNTNIDGGFYDILEVDSTNCHIKNATVKKKLIINSVNLKGSVNVYSDCIIDIDSVTDNLKISHI